MTSNHTGEKARERKGVNRQSLDGCSKLDAEEARSCRVDGISLPRAHRAWVFIMIFDDTDDLVIGHRLEEFLGIKLI